MSRRVLEVGSCDMDHGQIRALIEREFDAVVVRCHGKRDALDALRQAPADLVLVNRILDRDQSHGLEIIRHIKDDVELARTPCMLITNFVEHQQSAVAAGAEPGFGKSELDEPATRARLSRYLA